jgi:hypothetical protein
MKKQLIKKQYLLVKTYELTYKFVYLHKLFFKLKNKSIQTNLIKSSF